MKTTTSATDYKAKDLKVGDLIVWHVPQIPMKSFVVQVDSWEEAMQVKELLAHYDLFQYEHRIKPDYSNVSGVMIYGGQKYIDEWRDGVDPSEWSDDDGLCDVEDESDYQEQLTCLGINKS